MNAPKFQRIVTITVHLDQENGREEDAERGGEAAEAPAANIPADYNLEDAFEHWWAVNRAVYKNAGRREVAWCAWEAAKRYAQNLAIIA